MGIIATDHLGQRSRILNRAGDRANLVQRRGHSDQPVTRNCAVCGLCAHGSRHSTGLTDRTTGIRAQSQRRHERRNSSSGTTSGAAGDTLKIPRVSGTTVSGVLGRRAHSELVHVGLTQDRHSSLVQKLDDSCIVGRQPSLKDLRRTGRGNASGHHVVLDRNGHACQARQFFPSGTTRIHVGSSCKSTLTIDIQEGVDLGVNRIDAIQACLSELNRSDFTATQQVSKLAGGLLQQRIHQSSSKICGTKNIPSSCAGACAKTSSRSSVGPTTSSRHTFDSGMGCEVAGTSGVATSETFATASVITSNSPAILVISSGVSAIRANPATRVTSSVLILAITRMIPARGAPLIPCPSLATFE